jgi:hypothetical protein
MHLDGSTKEDISQMKSDINICNAMQRQCMYSTVRPKETATYSSQM